MQTTNIFKERQVFPSLICDVYCIFDEKFHFKILWLLLTFRWMPPQKKIEKSKKWFEGNKQILEETKNFG
jgi:hypothetical protein